MSASVEPGRTSPPAQGLSADDAALLARLRAGDEAAFATLVDRHHAAMLRLALVHCPRREAAEEVVQETWLAVLEGLAKFEARSSLATWIFSILLNRAKTRGARERRSVPFTDVAARDARGGSGDDADDRFLPAGHRYAGHWAREPRAWNADAPDRDLLSREAVERVDAAFAALPPQQREVITLRDVQGLSAEEARNVLGVSETNQRVLLHRARTKVRRALEAYFEGDPVP